MAFPPTEYKVRVLRAATGGAAAADAPSIDGRCTVLLHGLARTAASMRPLADALVARGSAVALVDYPSRAFPVETLAPTTVARGFGACRAAGATRVDVGIVAGGRSINVLLSLLLPNPDDGKVSAARTRLEGMCGWLLAKATHPLMTRKRSVIDETIRWLETGRFASAAAEHPPCPGRP